MFYYNNTETPVVAGTVYSDLDRGQAFYLTGDSTRDKTALRVKSKHGHTVVIGGTGEDPNGHMMPAGNYIPDDKINENARVKMVDVTIASISSS